MSSPVSVLVVGDGSNLRPSRRLLHEAKNQGMAIHIDSVDTGFNLTDQKPGDIETEFEIVQEDSHGCLLQEIAEQGGKANGQCEDCRSTIKLIKGCLSDPGVQECLTKEYDLCFMLETVQFLPANGTVQQEIVKRLRTGGRVVISAAETIDAQKYLLSALTLLITSNPELKKGMWPGAARAINKAPGVGKCAIEHFDGMVLAQKFTFRTSEILSEDRTGAQIMQRGTEWLHPQQKLILAQHREDLEVLLDKFGIQDLRYEVGLWVVVKSHLTETSPEFQIDTIQDADGAMGQLDNSVLERCCQYLRTK